MQITLFNAACGNVTADLRDKVNCRMTQAELRLLQALPLEDKIRKSRLRVREWYEHFCGSAYVSFSGGKDSTVLLHLARSMYPNIPAVYCDTGLEYPEVREFVSRHENIQWIKPSKSFREVLADEGYPVVSKRVSQALRELKTASPSFRDKILNGYDTGHGISRRFSLPKRWQYLIHAPFKISDRCCDVLKKRPFHKAMRECAVMTGEMACDSEQRLRNYLERGCNAFNTGRPKSTPLGFWTEQDILQYLCEYNVPYSSVYGDITKREDGTLATTGCKRTGCMFCMFGVQLEGPINRFVMMQSTHPKLYDYCVNKLGIGRVLDYMQIPYASIFNF